MTFQMKQIASIVEGHGEVQAVPEMLRRISRETYGSEIMALKPHRVPRHSMSKGPELSKAVQLQAGRVADRGGIVVLADADDDEPEDLRQAFQATADGVRPGIAVVVIAVREYEAWFLAGIESLRVHRSVMDSAVYPADPEARRGCKESLSELMNEPYTPIRHQTAFTGILDIKAARLRSPSLSRLVDAVGEIVTRT